MRERVVLLTHISRVSPCPLPLLLAYSGGPPLPPSKGTPAPPSRAHPRGTVVPHRACQQGRAQRPVCSSFPWAPGGRGAAATARACLVAPPRQPARQAPPTPTWKSDGDRFAARQGRGVVGTGGASTNCIPVPAAPAKSPRLGAAIGRAAPSRWRGGGSPPRERRAPGGGRRGRRHRDGGHHPSRKRPKAGRVAERRGGGATQPAAAPTRGGRWVWGSPACPRLLGEPGGGARRGDGTARGR